MYDGHIQRAMLSMYCVITFSGNIGISILFFFAKYCQCMFAIVHAHCKNRIVKITNVLVSAVAKI